MIAGQDCQWERTPRTGGRLEPADGPGNRDWVAVTADWQQEPSGIRDRVAAGTHRRDRLSGTEQWPGLNDDEDWAPERAPSRTAGTDSRGRKSGLTGRRAARTDDHD